MLFKKKVYGYGKKSLRSFGMGMEEEIKKAEEIWRKCWTSPLPEGLRKYYKGFEYTRSPMFNDELNELEDIYADGLEEVEAELDCLLPGFLQSMEWYVHMHKKRLALKQKLMNMEHKRGVMDDTNT